METSKKDKKKIRSEAFDDVAMLLRKKALVVNDLLDSGLLLALANEIETMT